MTRSEFIKAFSSGAVCGALAALLIGIIIGAVLL